MTTTKADEALLVIDVQNEYFTGRLPVTFPEGSLNNILRAMDYAASAGMPVAIIQHSQPRRTLRPSEKAARNGNCTRKLSFASAIF